MISGDCLDWNREGQVDTPRIHAVKPLEGKHLLVMFVNGVAKIYDCNPIILLDRFQLLRTEAFFQAVRVDGSGYGIAWDDEADLSEYELWHNGVERKLEETRHVSETLPT
jgi:Protein of unknown function (DUF2442)